MHARSTSLATALAAVLALVTLAGCGSSGAASATTVSPTAVTTTSTAPAATAPGTTTPATTVPSTATPTTLPGPEATVAVTTADSTGVTTADSTAGSTAVGSGPLTIDELMQLGRPIVLAHAGGEDQHPHSTPFAFAESAAAHVDMLDFDVQLSKDGVLVVQHDDTVERTTNGTGNVADMTYDELAALDNAYWFTADCVCTGQPDAAYVYRGVRTGAKPPPAGYTADDFVIPRFADIVRRFPDLPLNIEIKGTGDLAIAAAKELATELSDLDRLDNAVVTSFDDAVVTAFAGFAPTVELTPGLGLSSAWVLDDTPLPSGMRILQLPPVFSDIDVLTPETIAKSHAAGYVIWVWPNDRSLENLASYKRFLKQGMDGLNANFPAVAVEALAEYLVGAG